MSNYWESDIKLPDGAGENNNTANTYQTPYTAEQNGGQLPLYGSQGGPVPPEKPRKEKKPLAAGIFPSGENSAENGSCGNQCGG